MKRRIAISLSELEMMHLLPFPCIVLFIWLLLYIILFHIYTSAVIIDIVSKSKHFYVDRFAMGIEFRESSLIISNKSHIPALKGMVFNINVGFADLDNPSAKDDEGKKYALFLGDTVVVNEVFFSACSVSLPGVSKHSFQETVGNFCRLMIGEL